MRVRTSVSQAWGSIVVELGSFHEGVDNGCGFAAALGAHEHVVFAANGDAAHGAFCGVVVQLQKAVIQIVTQPLHAGQCVSDGIGQRRFARQFGQLALQPAFQIIKYRLLIWPVVGRRADLAVNRVLLSPQHKAAQCAEWLALRHATLGI